MCAGSGILWDNVHIFKKEITTEMFRRLPSFAQLYRIMYSQRCNSLHYENMPMQYAAISKSGKNDKFLDEKF